MSPEVVEILLLVAVAATPDASLKVAVAGSPPFVVAEKGELSGLSIDLWKQVALEAGLSFELIEVETVAGAIAMVSRGRADAAIGPISITAARTASVSFTQPWFRSRTGILAHAERASVWTKVKSFVSAAFFLAVGFLILILLVVGVLIWAIERNDNSDEFPADPLPGIGAGMWLALVTMTTVGYGDKAPKSVPGRVVVGIWMVISMITASSLTAAIATALTLANLSGSEITGLSSLNQRAVAVMEGTTAVDVARSVGARIVTVKTLDQSIEAVLSGRSVATVSDLPILQYEVSRNPEWPVMLIASDDHVENYGFAFRRGSPLLTRVNLDLLRLVERGELEAIRRRWLGH